MKQTIFNRTAPVIEPDVTAAAKKTVSDLSGSFPFAVGLNPASRRTMVKINVANKVFVEDALIAGQSHSEKLPFYLSMDDLQKKMTSFDDLEELIRIVGGLQEKLRDTQAVIGSEAYATALSLYHFFEQACKDGVPGMDAVCTQLGERFKGQGNNSLAKKGNKDADKS